MQCSKCTVPAQCSNFFCSKLKGELYVKEDCYHCVFVLVIAGNEFRETTLWTYVYGIRTFSPLTCPLVIFPLDIFHCQQTISPPFLHGEDIPPFHHYYLPIYNIKRSTVNVCKIDSGKSVRVRNTG